MAPYLGDHAGRIYVNSLDHGNEFMETTLRSQDGIASHRFEGNPADLKKRILALEEENANLQLLVCHLLKRNEELRILLYQQ